MTDPTPEDPSPDLPELEPEPEPELPPCTYPGELIYTTERRALMVVGSSRTRQAVACAAGHWHVIAKRSSEDGVPNPDPVTAEADPTNTEER